MRIAAGARARAADSSEIGAAWTGFVSCGVGAGFAETSDCEEEADFAERASREEMAGFLVLLLTAGLVILDFAAKERADCGGMAVLGVRLGAMAGRVLMKVSMSTARRRVSKVLNASICDHSASNNHSIKFKQHPKELATSHSLLLVILVSHSCFLAMPSPLKTIPSTTLSTTCRPVSMPYRFPTGGTCKNPTLFSAPSSFAASSSELRKM